MQLQFVSCVFEFAYEKYMLLQTASSQCSIALPQCMKIKWLLAYQTERLKQLNRKGQISQYLMGFPK